MLSVNKLGCGRFGALGCSAGKWVGSLFGSRVGEFGEGAGPSCSSRSVGFELRWSVLGMKWR